MLAAAHGQAWNASQVGQSMGLDSKTVSSYVDYLVGAFLIRRLPPYQANIRKRLVKSAKVYWRDSGLLHALLNVPDAATLLDQPWVGASWEGFVIEQILALWAPRTGTANLITSGPATSMSWTWCWTSGATAGRWRSS